MLFWKGIWQKLQRGAAVFWGSHAKPVVPFPSSASLRRIVSIPRLPKLQVSLAVYLGLTIVDTQQLIGHSTVTICHCKWLLYWQCLPSGK
jgi:hypothetical protein